MGLPYPIRPAMDLARPPHYRYLSRPRITMVARPQRTKRRSKSSTPPPHLAQEHRFQRRRHNRHDGSHQRIGKSRDHWNQLQGLFQEDRPPKNRDLFRGMDRAGLLRCVIHGFLDLLLRASRFGYLERFHSLPLPIRHRRHRNHYIVVPDDQIRTSNSLRCWPGDHVLPPPHHRILRSRVKRQPSRTMGHRFHAPRLHLRLRFDRRSSLLLPRR